jgi:Eph receptor B1
MYQMLTSANFSQLSLSWLPPSDPLLDIDLYEVKYYIRDQKSNTTNTVLTKKESIEITDLVEGTEYGLQVRARTTRGWGDFSTPLYAATPKEVDPVFMGSDKDQVKK